MTDYNVQFPDGTPLVIQTGTINNTYDIPLVGQDAINYGDDFATAYIRLLSNFANTSAPTFGTTRTAGQLWYDTTPSTGGLNVYDGTGWDAVPTDANVVHIAGAETITGLKTFSAAADFTNAGSPFTVNSPTLVSNLNAELLNGSASTAFASALQGTLADGAEPDLLLPSVSGYVLSSTTGGARSWISLAAGTGNVDPQDVSGFATPATTSILLTDDPTGDQQPGTDSGLTYNATTNNLSTTTFTGNLTGNAATATLATTASTATTSTQVTVASTDGNSSDTTTYPVLVAANTATDQTPHIDGGQLSYNASTGALTAAEFVGGGVGLTGLSASNISAGVLAVARGGTGVTVATGSGSAVALHNSPVFVTKITAPVVDNSAGVAIQYNASTNLQTQLHTGLGNTSGATVRTHDNALVDIGFNVLPQFGWDTTDTLEARHCGHLTGHSDGGAHTLTLEASGTTDFPIGGVATIVNGSATDYTVTEGSGTTLFYLEGGVGGTDTTGGCTIGAGGVATLYRFDATDYFIWGSEITP